MPRVPWLRTGLLCSRNSPSPSKVDRAPGDVGTIVGQESLFKEETGREGSTTRKNVHVPPV